jgi:hypothetical protein
MRLCQPTFEQKQHGLGGGIPALKAIWDLFDLSMLISQCGIRKHAGVPAWILCFAYIAGLVAKSTSTNKVVKFISDSPLFKCLLADESITQSAMSRFFAKSFAWLNFSVGRLAKLQDKSECRLEDGDIIALDDTKLEHPYGKKLPFLCWLFDYSDKRHVWCMNLISTLAVLKNGLEYPLLWRFWIKGQQDSEKQSKLDLAKQMLLDIRSISKARLFIAMDRWFLCKHFFVWLTDNNFDWVTKAKRNTVLWRKVYDPVLGKEVYTKLNPSYLLREVYPKLKFCRPGQGLSLPDIYIKLPYETKTRKGKPITRQRYELIAVIAATYSEPATDDPGILSTEEETAATYKDAYLLISNRIDKPDEALQAYNKRWRIEVFYRAAKQDFGLNSCTARSESAHLAHLELLFTAITLISYALWTENREGVEQAPTLSEIARCFINASYRISCCNQQIQVYFDIVTERFASLFATFWPKNIDFKLSWELLPQSA